MSSIPMSSDPAPTDPAPTDPAPTDPSRPLPAIAMTIAGSDPSGGAGLQADLKTFHRFGVYGTSIVTLLTVQNTTGVERVELLGADLVMQQLQAVSGDLPPQAVKTGALGSVEIIRAVAGWAKGFDGPLVVDPVMISKHGAALIDEAAAKCLVEELLPHAFLVTPNLHELGKMSGEFLSNDRAGDSAGNPDSVRESIDRQVVERAIRKLHRLGARNVLVKGLVVAEESVDFLSLAMKELSGSPAETESLELIELRSPRVAEPQNHGSGCVTSAAITALLAAGENLPHACAEAKRFIFQAISTAPRLGHGIGPVNMF